MDWCARIPHICVNAVRIDALHANSAVIAIIRIVEGEEHCAILIFPFGVHTGARRYREYRAPDRDEFANGTMINLAAAVMALK